LSDRQTQAKNWQKAYALLHVPVRVLGVMVLGLNFVTIPPSTLKAQDMSARNMPGLSASNGVNDSPMLLAADELVYDRDSRTITARGGVQIEYDGNRIVAQRVSYNQATRRVVASGLVEIVDAQGMRIYADEIDLTDDLGEGFINALRIEAADNTRFAATSVERSAGALTVFNNGIYTACDVCYDKPARDVLWQIKARKIIWNSTTKTMRFEDSRMELFGVPVAWLPVFEMADPTIKRKSGFLSPDFAYKSKLGVSMTNSYFWNLAPHYDFTLATTAYSKQGFLTQGEWRHRLQNGSYNLAAAYINQQDAQAFNAQSIDRQQRDRYAVTSKGDFSLNPRWHYGWDIMAQSDHNFSRSYGLAGYDGAVQRSQFYLTGLNGRNYFDARLYHFNVQEDILKTNPNGRHDKQPWVLPDVDYTYIPEQSFLGGQLSFHANIQGIYRDRADFAFADWFGNPLTNPRLAGISGTSLRLTGEMEWKKRIITDSGLIIAPLIALRSDSFTVNPDNNYPTFGVTQNAFRATATAGIEVSYPWLFTTSHTSHIIEPVAQLFIRNNEGYAGQLVNEDAQSFVFNANNLFSRDKFSGFDRVEGGTRANLGWRSSSHFGNDWSLYGLGGQSFHLSGRNSFAQADFVSVGADSGLETARSDYVAMLGADNGAGFTLAARGRFDKQDLAIRRGEFDVRQNWQNLSLGSRYAYIERQPDYGYAENRQEVSLDGSYKLNDDWTISASGSYDLVSNTLVDAGAMLRYLDECFDLLFGYRQTRNPGEDEPTHRLSFALSFRTIGDFGISR